MYLKSLTLRGFKSFADKTSLTFERGITAIVGPNGSGKSNISDAVLWVLGERNAKHLRGQAMEDVIFAGSSARKATSVAEVELVLDNSDHVLPMDYEEVVIARRMYRTGESEYLVNGAVARRMDVLDILHDTGLGVGTHSIISQGSIDSVLQSKPEDRRALIEEAAGVLKHKQRMARSARKLERMAGHVERISDIVGEVSRQLGPLERRAKRAKRYEELSGQLAEAKLVLATDDLRSMQVRHGQVSARTGELEGELEARKASIEEIDAKMEDLQKRLREESEDVGAISRQQRAASSALDRVRSQITLMRDRKRTATGRASEIEVSIESSRVAAAKFEEELARGKVDLESSTSIEAQARGKADSLEKQLQECDQSKVDLERRIAELRVLVEQLEEEDDKTRLEQSLTRESLTNGLAHMKVLDAHAAELELSVKRSEADSKAAESEAREIEEALKLVEEQERESRSLVAACSKAKDAARSALDEARASEQSIKAQIDALDAIEKRRSEMAGDARAWIVENRSTLGLDAESLSHVVKAEPGYESMVELLLAGDMDALVVDDESVVRRMIGELSDAQVSGEATFIMKDALGSDALPIESALSSVASGEGRSRLLDHINFPDSCCGVISAMLGDVIVCPNRQDALDARAEFRDARYVVSDGMVVWPSGKVSIGLAVLEEDQGVLARLRHLEELKSGLVEAARISEKAQGDALAAESALADAQTESLKLSERLAELRGSAQSARSLAINAAEKLSSATRELEEAVVKREKAESDVAQARPDMERHTKRLEELGAAIEKAKSDIRDINAELEPIAQRSEGLMASLNEAKLEAAKAQERKSYDELMVARHMQDIRSHRDEMSRLSRALLTKRTSAARLGDLESAFERLEGSARELLAKLEEASANAASSTSELHAENERLRQQSNEAHASFDATNQRLADSRVEKARIEMQVESAVAEIVDACKTPIEIALAMPVLENRGELEAEAANLDRRIANLGTINPDAAREYDELKERYDYLEGQLADLREASRSLGCINKMIEARMKEDFVTTFEEINAKFQENFALLFPGGKAHLGLEDPEDIENTGVEVNAQPAGKRISKMSLMSGGEKSLVAIALLFALYRTRPTPFYILDEVEAALDDTNLRRLIAFVDAMRQSTQLIMITHQRRTMEMADVLFGVSMQADGVTKVVSQKLEHALEQSE